MKKDAVICLNLTILQIKSSSVGMVGERAILCAHKGFWSPTTPIANKTQRIHILTVGLF